MYNLKFSAIKPACDKLKISYRGLYCWYLHAGCIMDLVFLLDQSSLETATDWNNIKTFVKNLVQNLTIDYDYVQVGIVTYGNPAINYVFFNTTEDVPTLLAQIDAIPYRPGVNNLASGITQVRLKFDIST